jgi:hypothetical protein
MTVIVSIHRALTHRAGEIVRVIANNYPSGSPRDVRRWWCGWAAVVVSTTIAAFWAFWGAAETFHEGWYYRELWRNVGLSVVQYFPAMLISMGAGLLAVWRPAAGVIVHAAGAIVAFRLFRHMPVGMNLVAWPLLALAGAYSYGRPAPRRWAIRLLVAVPLVTALVSGAYPAWRVATRPDDVDTSMRRITGNGVDLIWAPEGPGWDSTGFDWFEAKRRCEYLNADGRQLAQIPRGLWRLPTVDEAVRSMTYRRKNVGGTWDPLMKRAAYRVMPDKEAPLWNRYSRVIYWWTADEAGTDRAYRVSYNGAVHPFAKQTTRGYFAARCVKPNDGPQQRPVAGPLPSFFTPSIDSVGRYGPPFRCLELATGSPVVRVHGTATDRPIARSGGPRTVPYGAGTIIAFRR